MKLFEFIKKRKVEDKPQSTEKVKIENATMNQNEVKMETTSRSNELYFDDSDIGYC